MPLGGNLPVQCDTKLSRAMCELTLLTQGHLSLVLQETEESD